MTEKLLEIIVKRPDWAFDKFCEALIADDQGHVVTDYLRPITGIILTAKPQWRQN